MLHCPFVAGSIWIRVAFTEPDEFVLPCAVTHVPIFSDFAVVADAVVSLVLLPACTVTDFRALELNCRSVITIVEPDTERTVPLATAPKFEPGLASCRPLGTPLGAAPLGNCAPLGGAPVGLVPVGRGPPNSPGHDPSTGRLTLIRAAVNDVADGEVPDGAIAVTQSCFLIFASVVATVRVNVVFVV